MLQDKIVIVTGAFGALGRVVAGTLATQGARLALVDAAPAGARAGGDRVRRPPAAARRGPVQRAGARRPWWPRWWNAIGALDAVVNIAGGFRWETVAEGDPATWDLLFTVNLKTALHVCQRQPAASAASGPARASSTSAPGPPARRRRAWALMRRPSQACCA